METDSIQSLLRKIHALASDPRAPEGERVAARGKLERLLTKHALTEADLCDDAPRDFHFIPVPKSAKEKKLAIQLIAFITEKNTVRYRSVGAHGVFCAFTKAQAADCLDAWEHYLPLFRENIAQVKKNAARMNRVAPNAFFERFKLFSGNPSDDGPELTRKQIEEAMLALRMSRKIEGPEWNRKAGPLPSSIHLLQ